MNPFQIEWDAELLGKVSPHTLLGPSRLMTLKQIAYLSIAEGIKGAFVECGTMNGGSGAVMAHMARVDRRQVWLFDSFEGLPPAGLHDGVGHDGAAAVDLTGRCLGTEASVREVLAKVGAEMEDVHIIKGWYEDTLAGADTGPIAMLHMDADWYSSTRLILAEFYDRVAPGGFIVVDDYGHWPGCRKAVDEFFEERGLAKNLTWSDYTGVWWKKDA